MAVAQWVVQVRGRCETSEPALWLPRMGPQAACMHTSAPVSAGAGDQVGEEARCERRTAIRSGVVRWPRAARRASLVQLWREAAALKVV